MDRSSPFPFSVVDSITIFLNIIYILEMLYSGLFD